MAITRTRPRKGARRLSQIRVTRGAGDSEIVSVAISVAPIVSARSPCDDGVYRYSPIRQWQNYPQRAVAPNQVAMLFDCGTRLLGSDGSATLMRGKSLTCREGG